MHGSILMTPFTAQDESRRSWLHIDATENTMVEDRIDEMYATNAPPLHGPEWGMR